MIRGLYIQDTFKNKEIGPSELGTLFDKLKKVDIKLSENLDNIKKQFTEEKMLN